MVDVLTGIERIRMRFLERLETQHAEFSALAEQAAAGLDRYACYDQIRAGAHKVAGLAKSVGFEDLGKKAFALDVTIQAWEDSDQSAAQTADVEEALAGFLTACAVASGR